MEIILLMPLFLSMILTLISIPSWIKRAKNAGLEGKDMNKFDSQEKVAESGGICVLVGFIFGVLIYIAIKKFYLNSSESLLEILTILAVLLITSFMGFADDILGWKIGLNKTARLILLSFACLPLLIVASQNILTSPSQLSFAYPIFLMIFGFVGASATFNFLAGYNGLEISQGIIIISSLVLVNYIVGNSWLSVIGLIMVSCLLILYLFNKFPAKVFPGNVLTYTLGAFIAILAVFGHMELIAIFFFIPYILETILKVRGKLKKESFAKVNEDGSLEMPYDKIYGLEHLAIFLLKKIKPNKKVYEKEVVYLINAFQIGIIILGLIIFKVNPFVIFSKIIS